MYMVYETELTRQDPRAAGRGSTWPSDGFMDSLCEPKRKEEFSHQFQILYGRSGEGSWTRETLFFFFFQFPIFPIYFILFYFIFYFPPCARERGRATDPVTNRSGKKTPCLDRPLSEWNPAGAGPRHWEKRPAEGDT